LGVYGTPLSLVGATYEKARIVNDGNVITAGGVTAGIDFGLSVAAEVAGEATAREIQLGVEYDPAPPFDQAILIGRPHRSDRLCRSLRKSEIGASRGHRAIGNVVTPIAKAEQAMLAR